MGIALFAVVGAGPSPAALLAETEKYVVMPAFVGKLTLVVNTLSRTSAVTPDPFFTGREDDVE